MFLVLFVLASCSRKGKVYIIKQWHLSPSESTIDIEKSKDLPQYDNQIDIYNKSLKLIVDGSKIVIAEGCEGEIESKFAPKFNGWGMQDLIQRKEKHDFVDILAPVPMKLKAFYGDKLKVVCGDNIELIKKNNLAFSDTKAFSGFFQRLSYYQDNDLKSYHKYLMAFKNVVSLKDGDNPILIAKNKAMKSLNQFGQYVESRNLFFLKKIIAEIKNNPIVIIGGLHIPGIVKKLKEEKIEYEVITPVDYPKNEYGIFSELKKSLDRYQGKSKVFYNQVPNGFDPHLLKYKNLISVKQLATKKEWNNLKYLSKKYHFDLRILRLDMDKDGVRDFSISTSPNHVIISAEDDDWDNDKISNLFDTSIGNKDLFKISYSKSPVVNHFQTKGLNETKILEFFKKHKIKLLETKKAKHDIFILKIFSAVIDKMKLDMSKVRALHATEPSFTYGKQVFFSYVPASKVVEIYPKKLYQYLNSKKQNDFKGADARSFFNGFVTPLIIHSAAHELGHSVKFNIYNFAKKNGWKWKEEKLKSKYMISKRLKLKKLEINKYDYKYADLSYAQWLEQHKKYLKTVNEYLKKYPKNEDFLNKVKELKWYTKTDSKAKEYQVSFLVNRKIPSLYSMSQPKEWIAELIASCIFRKFYPKSMKTKEAIRLELTIGLNPTVPSRDFCKFF